LIGYFDASALVKRYVEENHSREVADLLSTTIAVTCRLSESEIASALAAMQRDLASLWVVEISPDVSAAACRLLMRHKLRAGDALQLASALVLAHRSNLEIKFICFDQSLNKAAVQEGIMLPGSGRKM
jgi:predicted nucleic acid-binding protein